MQPGTEFSGELYWDLYYASSSDGGRTWSRNIRISDRTMHRNEGYTFNSQYGLMGPAAVASTNEADHFAWADSRRGTMAQPTEDYYFTSALWTLDDAGPDDDGTSPAIYFVLGSVAMLAVVGLALLVVSRAVKAQPESAPGG